MNKWERNPDVEEFAFQCGMPRERILRTRIIDLEQMLRRRPEPVRKKERLIKLDTRNNVFSPEEVKAWTQVVAKRSPKPLPKRPVRTLGLPKINVKHIATREGGLAELNEIVKHVLDKADGYEAALRNKKSMLNHYSQCLDAEDMNWMRDAGQEDMSILAEIRNFLCDTMEQLGRLVDERHEMLSRLEHEQPSGVQNHHVLLTKLKTKTMKMELLLKTIQARYDCIPIGSAQSH